MNDQRLEKLEKMVAGLILSQQVLADALIRHDALAYHQLREALADAEEQLAKLEGEAGSEALLPIRRTLRTIEALHAPHRREDVSPAPNWNAALQDLLGKR